MPKNTIYVYGDEGVCPVLLQHVVHTFSIFLNWDINILDAKAIAQGTWTENAALFILPGGADIPYVDKLTGCGNAILRAYVKNGGRFLGICAGAYYAAAFVEFNKKSPMAICGPRPLQFFPGRAIGPVFGPYNPEKNRGKKAVVLHTIIPELPRCMTYYHGGCFFSDIPDHTHKVIASYVQHSNIHMTHMPAIVMGHYGLGKTLLSGVHYEYNPFLEDHPLSKSMRILKKYEHIRKILVQKLMTMLDL